MSEMKRNNLMLTIVALLIFVSLVGKHSIQGAESDVSNLEKIVEGLQLENISIDEWNVYMKKPIQDDENVQQMIQEFRLYKWSEQKEENVHKWIGTREIHHLNVKETLQIVTTTINNHSQSYILYNASGTGWHDEKWADYTQYFNENLLRKFNGNVQIFTCVRGHTSDKIESVLQFQAERILDKFRAKSVEALVEENFVSISGLTSDWNQAIPTEKGNMNIQVALRNAGLGGNTTVIVGTPIITTEY